MLGSGNLLIFLKRPEGSDTEQKPSEEEPENTPGLSA
jgi:hypothetical protein